MNRAIRDAEHSHNLSKSPFTASNTRANKSSMAIQYAFWAGLVLGFALGVGVMA